MTNEEHAALITDCKAEINSLEWQLKMRDSSFLQSCLKRQQIALASLEAEPVYQFICNDPDMDSYAEWADCNTEYFSKEPSNMRRILYTAPPVAVMHPDELRMDWLCAHCVEVREPLMYGSHAMFHAQQDSEEWDLPHHTTLREQIDEAIRAAGGSVKE